MKNWPVHEAKARFSKLLEACATRGPQIVTRRGVETAVVISVEEWQRLAAAKPTLKELLLADHPRGDLVIPPRRRDKRRAPPVFK